jgi:hypothetical protein
VQGLFLTYPVTIDAEERPFPKRRNKKEKEEKIQEVKTTRHL